MTEQFTPPDGGIRATFVVIASFLCNGIIFGFINTYSVLYVEILKVFDKNSVENAQAKASLIGSLTIGTTFFLSMIAGIISDRVGIRVTTFIGGFIASINVLAASFFTDYVYALMLTYGILFGVGASLAYIPSLSIIGHYYKRNIGIANGLVTVGSSVFSVGMPYILGYFITNFGLNQCLRIMGMLLSSLMLCSLVFKPLYKCVETAKPKSAFENILNVSIWKNKKFVIWVFAVPLALSGYFVPYVHMVKFIGERFPGYDDKLPITAVALTSGIGRILFGFLSDRKGINSIVLQQLSFLVIGTMSIMISMTTNYILLVSFNLILGIFDGCFVSLVGPVAFKFCGPKGAGQAIGFMLGFTSLPLIVGPPIAAWLRGLTGSYTVPFIVAGIPPIVGALLMTLIHFVKSEPELIHVESSKPTECNPLTNV